MDREISQKELEKFVNSKEWQKTKEELNKDNPELIVMLTKCISCNEVFPILVIDNHKTTCMNQLKLWQNFSVWHLYGRHCTTPTYQCYTCTDKNHDYPFCSKDELDNEKCPECGSDNIHCIDEDSCEEWLVTHDNDKYIIWNAHNYTILYKN